MADMHGSVCVCVCVCVCSLVSHVVEVEAYGPGVGSEENCFSVKTVRNNPASSGVVTGKETYTSFLSSLLGESSKSLLLLLLTFSRFAWQRKGRPFMLNNL